MADQVIITANVQDAINLTADVAEGVSITSNVQESTTITASVVTGAKGDTGDTGLTGPQGEQGPIGLTGPQGIQGEQGIQGVQGVQGNVGPQGPAGNDGADGLIQSIVAGTNVTVDSTDPANPIVSAAGGGGSGDMEKADYDPTNINEQLVGLSATQTLQNKTFKHLTVKPTSVGGSASLFLNNDAGSTFEFFTNNGGSFGVYDQANGKQPFTIDPNTATDTLKLTSSGAAIKNINAGSTKIINVTDGVSAGDAVNKGQLDLKASLTGAETLTNKTLTTPQIGTIKDTVGNSILTLSSSFAGTSTLTAAQTTNMDLIATNLKFNGTEVPTVSSTSTLTNKNLTSGTNTFPTFNQNTTGTAANVTGTVAVSNGGTGRITSTTAYGLIAAGTTATGAQQTLATGTAGQILKSNGAAALPTFQTGAKADVGLGNVDNVADANQTSFSVKRQNDTTNTTVTGARIETGWGYIPVTTGVGNATETVTFQTAFTTTPIITVSIGGDSLAGTTLGSGGNNIEGKLWIKHYSDTTTNFIVRVDANANFGAAGNVFYTWIAIGS